MLVQVQLQILRLEWCWVGFAHCREVASVFCAKFGLILRLLPHAGCMLVASWLHAVDAAYLRLLHWRVFIAGFIQVLHFYNLYRDFTINHLLLF